MVTISGVQPNGQLQEIWVQFGSIQFRFNWNQNRDYVRHSKCKGYVT